tara:strand:- start:21881 stop:22267 length:387 start_codon:yes stop_codon:yes gene_type:complete
MTKRLHFTFILGGFTVVLGAFGAHLLKKLLSADQLASFETGLRYQFYHVFFLMILSLIPRIEEKDKNKIALLIYTGLLLFSGSIYLLSMQDIFGLDLEFLGPVTPIGGSLLIFAWFYAAYKIKTYSPR